MNVITSTSTEWQLLVQRVDDLYHGFGWVVGGIGVVATLVIVLFSVAHIIYIRRLSQQDLNAFKKGVEDDISKRFTALTERQYSQIEKRIIDLDRKAGLHVSRLNLSVCRNSKQFGSAFIQAMVGANLAHNAGDKTEANEFLSHALEALKEVSSAEHVEQISSEIDSYNSAKNELRATFSEQVSVIEEKYRELVKKYV